LIGRTSSTPTELTTALNLTANKTRKTASQLHRLQLKWYGLDVDDFSRVVIQLRSISKTLYRLEWAMSASPTEYTEIFSDDLDEIMQQLESVYIEVEAICLALRSSDCRSWNDPFVLLDEQRAHELEKHLKMMEQTLANMLYVIEEDRDKRKLLVPEEEERLLKGYSKEDPKPKKERTKRFLKSISK
jgi:hypothetical protein